MNLANLSISRPIFITCIVVSMLSVGYLSLKKLGVDQFPNITFPVVYVQIPYPGAGPTEIETLIARPLEEELSTVPGIKTLRSISQEGVAIVVAEFTLETDIKYAEQTIKDRTSSARRKLPADILEPVTRRVDPADQPIMTVAISGDMTPAKLYEFVDTKIKPKFEQISQVGLVDLLGGRKREIQVTLDRAKLKQYELSATMVNQRIGLSGQNIPAGKYEEGKDEKVYRTLGEFKTVKDIEETVINFLGNDIPISLKQVGRVTDSLQEEKSLSFFNGNQAIFLDIYRQSGANTVAVGKAVFDRIETLNKEFGKDPGAPKIKLIRDGAMYIRANVYDVQESILIGIVLTIIVVYFFLGSVRSTLITGLALPNSLLGAFILMAAAGFTINVMTLLALSLSVGLLVDDAIVVRENIYRHIEMGKSSIMAALEGTKEVTLAVVATTLTVIAVFAPISFLQGVVGQFFKEFGMTICFAMAISLFDALTIAPMMSAYFAGSHESGKMNALSRFLTIPVRSFGWFQDRVEDFYLGVLRFTMRLPFVMILLGLVIFAVSMVAAKKIPKTFLSAQDNGEFSVAIDTPPGTSVHRMNETAQIVDKLIRSHKEVSVVSMVVGKTNGQPNVANYYVHLVSSKERPMNTSQFKDIIRKELKQFAVNNPVVKDIDMIGGGGRPFLLNIVGENLVELETFSRKVQERLKNHPALRDVDLNIRPGKPEVQVVVDRMRAEKLGISTNLIGNELRTQIEGTVAAVFRENGQEYDIRVYLEENQRNLTKGFANTYAPNINNSLIKLNSISQLKATNGPSTIYRQDRSRYVQIQADLTPDGPGMAGVIDDINKMFTTDLKIPLGMRHIFTGQAENFKELIENMIVAVSLSILFIFLVLASLYESFVTPFTIMLVLPLAASGAFFALLATGKSLDLFAMIGCILLFGIATKNSILLVDYANQQVLAGMTRREAMMAAGKNRLRPILMTSVALIAGMLPVAIGLNEASRQRTSMGVAIIGGIISSTLLSLVIVPAAYEYVDRFRVWSKNTLGRIFLSKDHEKNA